jgi:HlyD family secretion protein
LGVVAARFVRQNGRGTVVETMQVGTRTVTQVVTASGKVQPEVEVIISSDVSGEIIQLPVREGDHVRQGQLLARVKPDFYAAQVEQAEANVMQTKAGLAQRRADLLGAEAELKRQQTLFEKNAIAASVFEQARTQYEVALAAHEASEFAVQSSEAALREARELLGKTALYAPMTGTVSKLDVELGERVVGTSQMAGTEIMRIARLDQMEIEVEINENDVVNVALGDTAQIEVDAYPERSFRGVVTEIANSARLTAAGTQEQVTNFPVKVRLLDVHNVDAHAAAGNAALQDEAPTATGYPNFRPGMSGTVDIFTETVANVLAVPIQAVTVRDLNRLAEDEDGEAPAEEGEEAAPSLLEEDLRKVVFVMAEGKARMVEVETGIADDRFIEVKTGLSGGEMVITGPYRAVSRELSPDAEVRVEAGRSGPPSNVSL